MTLLKQKTIRPSKRGLTFSDISLGDIGQKFTYVVDKEQQQLTIYKSDTADTTNSGTFSRKQRGDTYIPLVDIRSQKAQIFDDADYLLINIYHDRIVVEAYAETAESKMDTTSKARFHPDSPDFIKLGETTMHADDFAHVRRFSPEDIIDIITDRVSYEEASTLAEQVPIALEITEFFCGAGVMSQGLKDAGFTTTLAIDFNAPALATYQTNFPETVTKCQDIDGFNQFREVITPIIVGGPPCQGFSNANRMSHYLDNPKNQLVKAFVTTIKQSKSCKVFVLENVPQILTAGNGYFRDEIINQLPDYEITYGILDASDYGTAQARKRAIFIGSKIGEIDLPNATHGTALDSKQTIQEAFHGLTDDLPNQKDYSKPRPDTVERMRHVPQGGNWEQIPNDLKNAKMVSGKTQSTVYKRLDASKPSITIVNPRKSLITHPTENRIVSIRECARLFDLPDTFQFVGSLSEKQQQIANGVPARLARAIGLQIRKVIERFNQSLTPNALISN